MSKENMEEKRVSIKTKEIDLPKIDLSKHVGKKVQIKDAGTYEGKFGFFAKFETDVIETIKGGKEPIEIKASVIFGLQEDDKQQVGWGKDTKLGKFLAKHKSETIEGMVGKECIAQIRQGNDAEFLTLV